MYRIGAENDYFVNTGFKIRGHDIFLSPFGAALLRTGASLCSTLASGSTLPSGDPSHADGATRPTEPDPARRGGDRSKHGRASTLAAPWGSS
ncbi:hypothetical protein GN956_G18700 [Arapaima gigas]